MMIQLWVVVEVLAARLTGGATTTDLWALQDAIRDLSVMRSGSPVLHEGVRGGVSKRIDS
jgi:hypothetical protein